MKDIAFVSACFGPLDFKEYWEYVHPTVDRYCRKFDFDFKLIKSKLGEKERSGQWTKIPALLSYIDQYDWLVWIDADIMIMNHAMNIRDHIDDRFDLIITSFNNSEKYDVNTGFFMLRSCEWSKKFLKKVYYGKNYYTENPTEKFHEQSSMELFFEANHPNNNVLIREPALQEPTLHKTWPIDFPDMENLMVKPDSGKVQKFKERNKSMLFHKGDFCVHLIGHDTRGVEGRKRDYELLSNHVLWHE